MKLAENIWAEKIMILAEKNTELGGKFCYHMQISVVHKANRKPSIFRQFRQLTSEILGRKRSYEEIKNHSYLKFGHVI